MNQLDFSNYLSPFTWRYGSKEMRFIFSEQHKYEIWRKIWVALATVQQKAGLVSKQELADLKKQQNTIDIARILEIEKETKHDVVAAIKEFAEKAKVGGGKIHLGATSMDVTDNADSYRMQEALTMIEEKIKQLLVLFSEKIALYADMPCIGYTHLQPAEPTTVGYRLAFYAQDLLANYEQLQFVKQVLKGKGLKGAVGTAASYHALLKDTKMDPGELEREVMDQLGLIPVLISSQVSPRQFDYVALTCLAAVAASLAKFAGDLRILQSPNFGEWSEPFGKKQVGSSAMPFKKNPINAEKICSLARTIAHLPNIALENATVSYLERTLDDSANRRTIIPDAFLATDEVLMTTEKIVEGLVINENKIALNLAQYAPFAATESILMASVKKGANRQTMHELLREVSLEAWAEIQRGEPNPMGELLAANKEILKYLKEKEVIALLDAKHHVGTAPKRALQLVKYIRKVVV